jgi:hypothetical protein
MKSDGNVGNALVVDPARVVHETVDGEVIIIQLERANYYSLAGSGREIWEMICAGMAPAAIVERLESAYEADSGEIERDVSQLITRLREEELVAQAGSGGGPAGSTANGEAPVPPLAGGVFLPAKLEKYTDMQDFLMIDPIHEVTAEGWPTVDRSD